VLAVVPARGGSDRVPYLNIKRLGDKPLLAHTLEAAQASAFVDRLVVSTDDPRVRDVARHHGAEVPFLRPKDLAGDIPSLKPVIAHAVAAVEATDARFDVVVVLQATTPFRSAASIDASIRRLLEGGYDSVVSVTEDRTLKWRAEGGLLQPLFQREGRRDEQTPVYHENGAIVAMRRAVLDAPSRFGARVSFIALDKRESFTVYDLEDFWMAERLLREPRVLFRVDGGASVGMGHVYRSLAVADALRQSSRAEVAFLMQAEPAEGPAVVSRAGYPVRLVDRREAAWIEGIGDFAPDVLINDLPRLEEGYLRGLSHLGATTVNLVDSLDDLERTEAYASTIVSVMNEERETPEEFYGGPAYAILRSHFQGRAKEIRTTPRMVLLSFGGSDPQGYTVMAARALQSLPESVEIVAVAGPAFSHRAAFEHAAAAFVRPVRLVSHVGASIADLMQEADLVVGSGGMTVYEIAALGTPGVVLAQNTREDRRMREFADHGTVRYLGLGTDVDESSLAAAVGSLLADVSERRSMSERGRTLVDGLGAARTAELVLSHGQRTRERE
jgi:spore coat polysaccharide biosynthesis predicted glycosyltransferase SpsG/CMP-N-acetylneuraminic acid synthetase